MIINWWKAIIIAIVQGMTEFLPVSSSGHLFLVQKLLGLGENMLFFDVVLHVASGVAILVVFWKDIWYLLKNTRLWWLIIVSSIPAVLGGVFLKDYIELFGNSFLWLGVGFLITAVVNFLIEYFDGKGKYNEMSWLDSLKIGLMQMLALLPAISRSGSTILGGRLVKMSKKESMKYAFLIAIPVVWGAGFLEMIDLWKDNQLYVIDWISLVVGFVVCLIVSCLVLKWFYNMIGKISFRVFGYYAFLLALVLLFSGLYLG